MSAEITTAVTLVGSVIAAGMAYVFTKWRERETEWRKEKREHYKDFAISLSGVVEGVSTRDDQVRFAHACNKLNLVAPQAVIEAMKAFQDEIAVSNLNKDGNRHDILMSHVFLEMRRDLQISPRDDRKTFRVRLWSPGPFNGE